MEDGGEIMDILTTLNVYMIALNICLALIQLIKFGREYLQSWKQQKKREREVRTKEKLNNITRETEEIIEKFGLDSSFFEEMGQTREEFIEEYAIERLQKESKPETVG